MAVRYYDAIEYKGKHPLDARTEYDTIAAMKSSYSYRQLGDGMVAWVKDADGQGNGAHYVFDSKNSDDETTGRWRLLDKPISDQEITDIVK